MSKFRIFLTAAMAVSFAAYCQPKKPQQAPNASGAQAARVILMKVTAYAPDKRCVGKWAPFHTTATGSDSRKPIGVAADFGLLPEGTKLYIPGVGVRKVDDTGGAMRKSARTGIYHIDVRFGTYAEAKRFGRKELWVSVLD